MDSASPLLAAADRHPTPQYARDPEGKRRTPAAPFHAGVTAGIADWSDLSSSRPLRPIYLDSDEITETHLNTARPGLVLCETIGRALQKNGRRVEHKTTELDGNPCRTTTTGPLRPAATVAIRTVIVGKETRNLDRAGISEDPIHTLYSDEEQEAWRRHYLPVLRQLAPNVVPRGRPSRKQRAALATKAGELARAALRARQPADEPPRDPEQACYLYVTSREERRCACGCGTPVSGSALYAGPSHRMRAHRARHADSRSPHGQDSGGTGSAPLLNDERSAAEQDERPATAASPTLATKTRVIGLAEFERAVDRVEWIAEWIDTFGEPGFISLHVGTARTMWQVRVRDTPPNRRRLADVFVRARVPHDYGTNPLTGERG